MQVAAVPDLHSRGRPDSTTLTGRDLPPHTYSTIALGGSMHHHGGTLFDSRARREGLRDADGCLSQGCTKGEHAYHPSKRLTLRATLEDQARGIRSSISLYCGGHEFHVGSCVLKITVLPLFFSSRGGPHDDEPQTSAVRHGRRAGGHALRLYDTVHKPRSRTR